MKKFVLTLVSLTIASPAFAELNCATPPSCADLGFDQTSAHCPKDANGVQLVVKCPFDTTKGRCIHEAAVGQIGYFTKAPGNGWLLCNGAAASRTKYPDLAKFIDTQFCNNTNHYSSACPSTGSTFAVPNYQGYFLRVYGTTSNSQGSNTSLIAPQSEALPNIKGRLIGRGLFRDIACNAGNHSVSGSLYLSPELAYDWAGGTKMAGYTALCGIGFDASKHNSTIYGDSNHVTPPNIAVYAYIYAGRVVE